MWNLIVTIVFAMGSSSSQTAPAAAIEAVPTPYMTEALCKKAADGWLKRVDPTLGSGGKAIATCSPAR